MSVRVLVTDFPQRTLALVTDTHILLFEHAQLELNGQLDSARASSTSLPTAGSSKKSDRPRCMVRFVEKSTTDLKGFRTLTSAKGTLGLITLGEDVFVCVVTGSREVAQVRPNETVMQIMSVEFYCLNRSDYEHGPPGPGAGYHDGYREPNPYRDTYFEDDSTHLDYGQSMIESPFEALKKLLEGGTFYYSYNFDLTQRLQDRAHMDATLDITSLDQGLLWNAYMINPLISFRGRLSDSERDILDKSRILTSVIRGYAGTLTIPTNANPIRSVRSNYPASLTIISRLSAKRAGTRFNSRGIDDNGDVSNFVETETIFWSPTGICFSYVQIRGSIPIFWEQASTLIPGQTKIQITRSPEATQLSFDRHFEDLEQAYGSVHVVNLLSETKPGEQELTQRYNLHLARSSIHKRESNADVEEKSHADLLLKTEFDFHEQARQAGGFEGAKRIKPIISESAEMYRYFLLEDIKEDVQAVIDGAVMQKTIAKPVVVIQQSGVFRTNCLDCLDRTNLIQGIISQLALELFLSHRGETASLSNLSIFWMRHSTLWADNGDALSKIYAGTGALKSSFTRHGKSSLGGFLSDARKSATRLYVNHFEDKGRQNTTDLLLGRLVGQAAVLLVDPVSDWVREQLHLRKSEFESSENINVWVGTYNLNGKTMGRKDDLSKWLIAQRTEVYDLVAVSFQEIVELNPQQIMNTDPNRRIWWEQAVKETLNNHETPEERYILLRSEQLVGAALMIYVKPRMLAKVKNVEGALKKTGVSGLAGNKGAVAIRMDVEGSTVCFVTAHLAAGFGNYDDRNRDYQTITSGLQFQRDRRIEDHEVVIWAGDFNYRIGTTSEAAHALVHTYMSANGQGEQSKQALAKLYKDDQLNIQMVAGQTFPHYHEGKLNFLPTYKFDLGTDTYDTSEKARIPAWTDRILYKNDTSAGTSMSQLVYNSVMDLRFSDHRPVYSTFLIRVRKIDVAIKTSLRKKLYTKRLRQLRETDGDLTSTDSDELEEITEYQSIAPGLPPASSDKRKWWLDGNKPVKSQIGPPDPELILNPNRNGNPWQDGGEDDWVVVPKEKPVVPAPRKVSRATIEMQNLPDSPQSSGTTTPELWSDAGQHKPTPSLSTRISKAPRDSLFPVRSMVGAFPQSRDVSMASLAEKHSPPSSHRTHTTTGPTEQLARNDLPRTSFEKITASSGEPQRKPIPPPKPSSLVATSSLPKTRHNEEAQINLLPSPPPKSMRLASIHRTQDQSVELPPVSNFPTSDRPPPPPLPRRASNASSITSQRRVPVPREPQARMIDLPPSLPPRKSVPTPAAKSTKNSLLDDDSGDDFVDTHSRRQTSSGSSETGKLADWKALVPNR